MNALRYTQIVSPSQASQPKKNNGREAQRRRTRAALIEATTRLLAEERTPSVDEIAAAADVSRRTVYMHFPTLDQLLLDAAVGALVSSEIDRRLSEATVGADAAQRTAALAEALTDLAPQTLPLGRKIVRLTVDAADRPGSGRGHRRIAWIEKALEPLRQSLSEEQYARLVSALSLVIGWEAMIVLRDVRGLSPDEEKTVTTWAARALVDAMLAEAHDQRPRSRRYRPTVPETKRKTVG